MSEQGCKHNFLGTEYDPAQCTECGVTLSEWKDDRIEALEAERDDANRVMREACEANRIFKAKLDAAHNWVLNTCPEEYNQFVKALGEAK